MKALLVVTLIGKKILSKEVKYFSLPRVGDNLTLGPFSEILVPVKFVIFDVYHGKKLGESVAVHLDGTKLEKPNDKIIECLVNNGWTLDKK